MKTYAVAVGLAILTTPAFSASIAWTDWTDHDTVTNQVTGTLDDNGTLVNVTLTSTAALTPAPQLNGFVDYYSFAGNRDAATSPYTNVGPDYAVDNVPTGTDIIRTTNASTYTLSFDQAISDIYFAFVSLNTNAFVFDTEAILLSAGGMDIDGNGTDLRGYWGTTSATSVDDSVAGEWSLSGNGEPHGTVVLPGTFTSLTWTGGTEGWHGFTVGVTNVALPPVPVPAAGLLLIGGLGGLAMLRRKG